MTTNIPDDATYSVYVHLAAARVTELQSLDQKLASCSSHGGRSYQKLPRHMQRRALSTNPKRVPRRMRSRHISESKSQPRVTKRPRRMYRSRPRDRVEEFTRRQQRPDNTWLETHVWHAKRFHMGRNWGYVLPLRPTQKMYRPILRAVEQRCVMQDRSFLCCVEVRGPRPVLLAGLGRILSSHGYSTVTAQGCLAGTRWAMATLYQPDKCPSGAVCETDIIWVTPLRSETNRSQEKFGNEAEAVSRAWLWVHPSAHVEVLRLFAMVFDLEKNNSGTTVEANVDEIESESDSEMSCEEEMVETCEKKGSEATLHRNENFTSPDATASESVPCDRSSKKNGSDINDALEDVPKSKIKRRFKLLADKLSRVDDIDYFNKNTRVAVVCLKDTMNRFTLRGPETLRVLDRVLVPTTVEPSSDDTSATGARDASQWWLSYFSDPAVKQALNINLRAWESMTSVPGSVDDNLVLPLLVRDPRVMLPTKREKIEQEIDTPPFPVVPCLPSTPDSPLYHASLRHSLLFTRRTDHQVNEQRRNLGVPGSALPLDDSEARMPVLLLLRRPDPHDRHSGGRAAPWELILPGGWGSSTWTALVYSGAVAAGTDSDTHLVCEEHQAPPVYLLPDTPAGQQHTNTIARQRMEDFFKMPPNKRPNFVKLGVQHPFGAPWPKLIDSLRDLREVKEVEDEKIGAGFANEVLSKFGMNTSKINEPISNIKLSSNDDIVDSCVKADQTNRVCVMRNLCHLKALDYLTCKSGSRRRIFRGARVDDKENHTNNRATLKSVSSIGAPLNPAVTSLTLDEVSDSVRLVQLTSQGQLLRVLLTPIGRGSIEPCATICRPTSADLTKLKTVMEGSAKPSLSPDEGILETRRLDEGVEKRKGIKKEHQKDLARLRRLRKGARRIARENYSFESGISLPDALKQAVDEVHQKEQVLMSRSTEYIPSTQQLCLLPEDGPLQQCSRLIIGYVTEANFSRVRGCGAGHGYVVAAALMAVWRHRLRRWIKDCSDGGKPSKERTFVDDCDGASSDGNEPEDELDVDIPLIRDSGIPVLFRNTNNLQYNFAMLTVSSKQPPS